MMRELDFSMHSPILFIVLLFFLFGCSAWAGSFLFLLENMSWLIEDQSQRTHMGVFMHENNVRSSLAGLISALIWAYPAYILRTHRHSYVGYLLLMPVVIISTAGLYLLFWPPQRQIDFTNALGIVLASGWKQFLGAYILLVFVPLQIFTVYLRRAVDNFGNGK